MMKRFKHVVSVALVLALMATGVLASACLAEEKTDGPATITVTLPSLDHQLLSKVHQQRYLTYLVKEFDPAALPDWEKAFAERNVASEKFEQMLKSAPGSLAVSFPEGAPIEKGEVKIETKSGQLADGKKLFTTSCIGTADLDQFNARIQVQKEFETAVENNDPAAIKNVLPKALADYRQTTEDMLKAVVNAK